MPSDSRERRTTRKETGILATPPATASSEPARGSCEAPASAARPRGPPASIATGDHRALVRVSSTTKRKYSGSSRVVLSLQAAQHLFGFFHISQRELAGFDEVGHDGLRASAE